MVGYKSIMDITREEWLDALKMSPDEIPDAVIVEGSWWRQQRTDWRLSYLSDVQELAFPDMFSGKWKNKQVIFCCAYGAPRTVEIIHLFSLLGVQLAIQIGTCGGLQSHLKPGDIVLPEVAIARDGVAHLYGATEAALASDVWSDRAAKMLKNDGFTVHRGTHLTWSSIFAQDASLVETWHRAGYLSVDMETATTFATASYFDIPAISMLVVWDDLMRGRSFLVPLTTEEQKALDTSNEVIYTTALELIEQT